MRWLATAALLVTVLAYGCWQVAGAGYTSSVSVPATVAASPTFPGVPALISGAGPAFYHRMDETQTPAAGSAAADAVNASAGVYETATNNATPWWRLDDPAGATVFRDSSGAGNTAFINGTAAGGYPGPTGGAVQPGNGGSLSALLSPFRSDRAFTVTAWFNPGGLVPTSSSTRVGVVHMTGNSSGTPSGTGTYPRSDLMIFGDYPAHCPNTAASCWGAAMAGDPQTSTVAFDYALGSTPVLANTWVQLTAVFDTTTLYLYVNGVLEGSVAHTIFHPSTNAGIGLGRYRDAAWKGLGDGSTQIGEVRAWRRALSGAELAQLPVRPTARWPFTEATGSNPTYTSVAASTGTPGVVAGSASVALSGGASLAAGRDGNALTMSAAGYVQGPAAQLATTGSFTVSAWVRLTDSSTTRTFVAENTAAATAVSLGYDQPAGQWVMRVLTSGGTTVPVYGDVTGPVVNQWVHLVGIHDDFNNVLRLYVNGVPQSSVAFAFIPAIATTALQIGRRLSAGSTVEAWLGQIDDVRVYNGYPLATAATTSATISTFVGLMYPAIAAEQAGGLLGTKTGHAGSTSVAFGGTVNASNAKYAATAATAAFTVECLIRVGVDDVGVIAGFAGTATRLGSGFSDRLLYVDPAGKVEFGVVKSGAAVTVSSSATVDDALWHHVMGSVGAAGLKLYVDGVLTTNTSVVAATAATGYWRLGGAPLQPVDNWPAAPGNPYLTGTVDEFAVYPRQLTDQENLWRVHGNY
ncbi:hypothetical protein GCM10010168_32090 [Actinoplanes ianthinogenes]|uniref:LamG-like jellyroll fold domain-containing protein n=1 Tax=Actinoplanes ianthinogenes TaxID=122358 RepID=A0ABM7LM80_9ACTN|nr:LamG domain-containing protein [Actinoplanes ianthinogenes]BCJ40350.1 hypothetical protein Aiant_10070 [Actinoplanes ianthinogenes]GGR11632.1 hypothetical protein GCM10010168_32090 [Actinoplanes ianthinogenes]